MDEIERLGFALGAKARRQEQAMAEASELTALRAKLASAEERADRNAAAVDEQARAIAEAVEAERAACEAVAMSSRKAVGCPSSTKTTLPLRTRSRSPCR